MESCGKVAIGVSWSCKYTWRSLRHLSAANTHQYWLPNLPYSNETKLNPSISTASSCLTFMASIWHHQEALPPTKRTMAPSRFPRMGSLSLGHRLLPQDPNLPRPCRCLVSQVYGTCTFVAFFPLADVHLRPPTDTSY